MSVAMSAAGPCAQVDAQRRSQHVRFDIMSRQRVASEQNVDPSVPNQLLQERRTSAVDDGRTTHEKYALLIRFALADRLGGMLDHPSLGPLGADLVAHEAELVEIHLL